MAAREESAPLACRVLKEPEWQKPHRFRIPSSAKGHSSVSGNAAFTWPEKEEIVTQRIKAVPKEIWGEPYKENRYSCEICYERYRRRRFHPLEGCDHRPFCARCLSNSIKEDLHGKGQTTMKCPGKNCKVKLQPNDVQRCCSRQDYDRFCSLSTTRMLETLEDFYFCTNKSNGCGSGQLHDPGDDGSNNVMVCHVCAWSTCTVHKEQMHYGLSCEEYDAWKDVSRNLADAGSTGDEEELTEALLHKMSRKCPQCSATITKMGTFSEDKEAEACHHMTCSNNTPSGPCGAEFCWLCGGLFYGGNPEMRIKLRQCGDPEHLESLKGYNGTLLHCHHKPGCARGD